MIHEVDEVLRALFRVDVLEGAQIAVVFDAPTREWAAKVNAPTVNLYLYDIREDTRLRERGLHNEYDDRGVVVARRRPPRYFKLSYLITAWTKRPEDEHRLLSSLLMCLLRYESLPRERLAGGLADIGVAVPMTVALPPPEDRSFADVWSALGGELKPSLDLVVSVPVTESPVYPVGPPVTDEGLRIGFSDHDPQDSAERAGPRERTPGGAAVPVYGRQPGRPDPAADTGPDAGSDAGPDAGPDSGSGSGSGSGRKRRPGIARRISEERHG
ncbi:DUF4255 domain-containing protein [Streptomyces zagrosensis]|uniref:Pvc16 N-terminal domain-containing protein n=1 Tax=Streptomyces zagrosensis TaxID=1042984 RepID=A0A7W9QCR1_9ACTN|nr:DUF4255 domain-containing protein [Streptomyces zagrosensis]MBB5936607.1 hypothetical protein [Streptomyces zagrosensis]